MTRRCRGLGRKFNYNNSFWALNQVWMNFYDIIRITNAALQSLDGYAEYLAAGSEDYKTYESYCGEVRTIVHGLTIVW